MKTLINIIKIMFGKFMRLNNIIYYRHVFFYKANIKKLNFDLNLPGVIIRSLKKEETYKILPLLKQSFHYILDQKNFCTIAEKGEEILGYHLLTPNDMHHECLFLDVKLFNKEVFTVSAYINEKWRNKGLLSAMLKYQYDEWIKNRVVKRHYSISDHNNIAIITLKNKFKSELKGHIKFIALFKKYKFFLRNDVPDRIGFTKT